MCLPLDPPLGRPPLSSASRRTLASPRREYSPALRRRHCSGAATCARNSPLGDGSDRRGASSSCTTDRSRPLNGRGPRSCPARRERPSGGSRLWSSMDSKASWLRSQLWYCRTVPTGRRTRECTSTGRPGLGSSDVHPLRQPRRTRAERSLLDAASWSRFERRARAVILTGVQQRVVSPQQLRGRAAPSGPCRHRALIVESIAACRRRSRQFLAGGRLRGCIRRRAPTAEHPDRSFPAAIAMVASTSMPSWDDYDGGMRPDPWDPPLAHPAVGVRSGTCQRDHPRRSAPCLGSSSTPSAVSKNASASSSNGCCARGVWRG